MKKHPEVTNETWWSTWLAELSMPASEEALPDDLTTIPTDDGNDQWVEEDEQDSFFVDPSGQRISREEQLCQVIQKICDKASELFPSLKSNRSWTAHFRNKAPEAANANILRKPDGVTIDSNIAPEEEERDGGRVGWNAIGVIIEEKLRRMSEKQFIGKAALQLYNESYCIFESQDDRRFTLGFTVTGDIARVSVMDRAGAVHSYGYSIYNDPLLFLHSIFGIAFAPDQFIGYDPTISVDEQGVGHISVGDYEYEIIDKVWCNVMIRGRATKCYLVKRGDEHFLIKDTWIVPGREPSEVYFYREASTAGVEGIPELYDWEDIAIDGVLDSTDLHRGVYPTLVDRLHRRLVFTNPGESLESFESKRELISALNDIVKCRKLQIICVYYIFI